MTRHLNWRRWLFGLHWGYNPTVCLYLGPLRLCFWRAEPATRRFP